MTEVITNLDISEKAMAISISSYHLSIDPALQLPKTPFKQTFKFDDVSRFNHKLLQCFQAYCDGSCDFSTANNGKWLLVFESVATGVELNKTRDNYDLMPYVCRKLIQASNQNKI